MTGMAGHHWRPKKERPAALFMEQKFSHGHALSAHDGSVREAWVGWAAGLYYCSTGVLGTTFHQACTGPIRETN